MQKSKTRTLPANWNRLLLLGGIALASIVPARAQVVEYLTGFDYSTGKYGEAQSTEMLYIPFAVSVEGDAWKLKLTVPFLRVNGPGNVVRDIGPVGGPVTFERTTETGIGDIVGEAGFDFYYDPVSTLTLTATAKVKLGTASRSRGLGTGEQDVMFQLDAFRQYGDWTPFGTLGYRVLGDPPGLNLRNGFYGSVGTTYRVAADTSVGGAFDFREKSSSGRDAAAELSAFVSHRLSTEWQLQGYTVIGLTDASPDFGLGGVAIYSF